MKSLVKTVFIPSLFILVISPVFAAQRSYDFQTGSSALDRALNKIAGQGEDWPEKMDIAQEITDKFGLSQAVINRLADMGYNYGEIYLMGLLHERGHTPVESLAALRDKGLNWKEVVRKVGLSPQRLNRYRTALNKAEKAKEALYSEELYQEGVPYYLKSVQEQQATLTEQKKARRRHIQAQR